MMNLKERRLYRKLVFALMLMWALLFLTACTTPVVTWTIDYGTPTPAVQGAEEAATPAPLAWKRCSEQLPAELECAQMQTPMNYAAPDGPTVTLTMTRLKATDPEKRIGSLIINPGGPGGAGSDILIAQAVNG